MEVLKCLIWFSFSMLGVLAAFAIVFWIFAPNKKDETFSVSLYENSIMVEEWRNVTPGKDSYFGGLSNRRIELNREV